MPSRTPPGATTTSSPRRSCSSAARRPAGTPPPSRTIQEKKGMRKTKSATSTRGSRPVHRHTASWKKYMSRVPQRNVSAGDEAEPHAVGGGGGGGGTDHPACGCAPSGIGRNARHAALACEAGGAERARARTTRIQEGVGPLRLQPRSDARQRAVKGASPKLVREDFQVLAAWAALSTQHRRPRQIGDRPARAGFHAQRPLGSSRRRRWRHRDLGVRLKANYTLFVACCTLFETGCDLFGIAEASLQGLHAVFLQGCEKGRREGSRARSGRRQQRLETPATAQLAGAQTQVACAPIARTAGGAESGDALGAADRAVGGDGAAPSDRAAVEGSHTLRATTPGIVLFCTACTTVRMRYGGRF
eukprot:scaffold6725_cov117-Isochrysis_galbana.AAC.2